MPPTVRVIRVTLRSSACLSTVLTIAPARDISCTAELLDRREGPVDGRGRAGLAGRRESHGTIMTLPGQPPVCLMKCRTVGASIAFGLTSWPSSIVASIADLVGLGDRGLGGVAG